VSENTTEERDGPRHATAAGFRLRPERPRVMRLSRKVLASLAAVACVAILGSVIWALDTRKRTPQSGQELFNTDTTLTIRPGFPVRVLVNRDLLLAQYQG
jgi:type IV secretory pathway VirB10-like protein